MGGGGLLLYSSLLFSDGPDNGSGVWVNAEYAAIFMICLLCKTSICILVFGLMILGYSSYNRPFSQRDIDFNIAIYMRGQSIQAYSPQLRRYNIFMK